MYLFYIVQMMQLFGDFFGFYEFKVIGEDFKKVWVQLYVFGIMICGNICMVCYCMGNMNLCQVVMQQFIGNVLQ